MMLASDVRHIGCVCRTDRLYMHVIPVRVPLSSPARFLLSISLPLKNLDFSLLAFKVDTNFVLTTSHLLNLLVPSAQHTFEVV